MLEHGHRWLATLLTGLVMLLFFGVVVTDRRRLRLPGVREWPLSVSELIIVVLLSVALVVAVAFNQSPRVAPEGQVVWGWLAIGLGVLCLAWLGGSLAVRRWSLPVRLMSVIWEKWW